MFFLFLFTLHFKYNQLNHDNVHRSPTTFDTPEHSNLIQVIQQLCRDVHFYNDQFLRNRW